MKFEYLKQFVKPKMDRTEGNLFISLTPQDIELAEARLQFKFPSQLREFYLTIGYGFFSVKYGSEEIERDYSNRLMDAGSVADISLLGYDSGQMHPEAEFEEGELPFFEIGEGRSFITMYPKSDNPNAVYHMGVSNRMIEPSLERFVWRLYYESPTFYLGLYPDA